MGLVRFVTTTGAGYSGITLKDKDTLYFISDERRIYKGEVPYSGGIFTTVAEFPETGEVNTLYVNSATGEVRYYNGTSYQTVVPATGKSITGKGDGSLATTAAVAAYVTSQIGDLNTGNSNSEIVDARVGVDGTAYSTLGTAIRTQVNNFYEYSENRLSIDNLTKDKYIETNGKIVDYPGWDLSDYIPVEKNETYVWTYDVPTTVSVHNIYYGLFDINRKWIGKGTTNGGVEKWNLIKTDDNTAYVRVSQASKFFTNKAMIIRKTVFDTGIKEFIPFKRYLKNSPTKEIEEKTNAIEKKTNSFDTNYQPNYDNAVRSIQRIGAGMEHPIHSVESFKDAYRKGFRILLCDLIFTSDNIPVCNHDSYLNQHYKNVYDSNGKLVSTDNPIYFSQNTYETLSKYNYGAMGYPLLKFVDMLKLVKQLGVELYVEIKGMTEQQAKIACDLVRQFGLSNKTSWSGVSNQMKWIITNIDTARVSIMPSDVTDQVIEVLKSLKTGKNKVFIFGWDTTILTDEIVNKLIQNDIAFEQGTLNTEQDIKNYFARGNQYYYCTGIESDAVIAGKVLLESSLANGAIG